MICICTKISWQEIVALVESGCEDWRDAAEQSGATRYCGNCLKQFRTLFCMAVQQRERKAAA